MPQLNDEQVKERVKKLNEQEEVFFKDYKPPVKKQEGKIVMPDPNGIIIDNYEEGDVIISDDPLDQLFD